MSCTLPCYAVSVGGWGGWEPRVKGGRVGVRWKAELRESARVCEALNHGRHHVNLPYRIRGPDYFTREAVHCVGKVLILYWGPELKHLHLAPTLETAPKVAHLRGAGRGWVGSSGGRG